MLKATSLRKLPLALLLAMVGALVRSASLALTGRPADALAVLWAWGWNVKELPVTLVHRRRLQKQRKVDDSALAPLRAPGGQRLRALLRGTLELVYGAEVGAHVAQRTDDSGEEQDMPSGGVSVLRVIASHPVAFMVAGVRPGHGRLAAVGAVRPGDRQHQPRGLAGHGHRAGARVRLQLPPGPDGLDRLRAPVAGPARRAVGADLREGPGRREAAAVAGPAAGRGHLHPGPAGGGAPAVGPGGGRAAVRDRAPGHRRPRPGPHRRAGPAGPGPAGPGPGGAGLPGRAAARALAPGAALRPAGRRGHRHGPGRGDLPRAGGGRPPSSSPWPGRVPTGAGWPPASRCTWPPGSGWPLAAAAAVERAAAHRGRLRRPRPAPGHAGAGRPAPAAAGRRRGARPAGRAGATRLWPWPPCSSPPPPAAAFRRSGCWPGSWSPRWPPPGRPRGWPRGSPSGRPGCWCLGRWPGPRPPASALPASGRPWPG